jgi:flagellar motor switch protein FliN/FliY
MKAERAPDEDGVYLEDATSRDDLRAAAAENPAVLSLPVSIIVSVGSAKLTVDQLLSLDADNILTLDAAIDDPVDLLIGGRVIARGALVESDGDPGGIGVRIMSIVREEPK